MIIIIDDSAKIQKERKEQHKGPFIYLKINDPAKVQKEEKKQHKKPFIYRRNTKNRRKGKI